MSEQRFTFDYEVEFEIFDRVTKKHYDGRVGCQEKICDLLNEQQATIQSLEEEIKLLKPTNIEQYEQIQKLQEENEQLRKQVAEYEMILRQHEFAEKEGFQ